MLFAINYCWRAGITAEETLRLRRLFVAWSPPDTCEIVAHYHYARGGAGIVIMRATDVTGMFQALAPFVPGIEFDTEPSLNVIEAEAIKLDVDEWATSLFDAEMKGSGSDE